MESPFIISDMRTILVLLAFTMEDLRELLNKINSVGQQYGLHINTSETKAMVISRQIQNANFTLSGEISD